MNDSQLIWEAYEDTHPAYEGTFWQDVVPDGRTVTITIQDVETMLDELNVPLQGTPVYVKNLVDREGNTLDIHTKNKAKKTPEAQAATHKRAMATSDHAIIVSMKDGVYIMVLDGNHRLHKALEKGADTINVRTLHLSQTPEDWQYVLR